MDWYPWGEEPFQKAKDQNRLMLVSIGYSSCHWCHVMEKESFEDEEISQYMNDNFICIKVDREEHPEVDSYYMSALQAMIGQGGWPLNMFLTPEGKPFYGGTYFPPRPMYGRASWLQVLMSLQKAWQSNDPEIRTSVASVQDFLSRNISAPKENKVWDEREALNILKGKMKKENGGFTESPKFPMLMTLDWMLTLAIKLEDDEAKDMVKMNMKAILLGGIYDQVQGGLMRYSTDNDWLVPHFEKMLYTQSQLIPLLARMYMHFPTEEIWKRYLEAQEEFMQSWMTLDLGYFSAIDADTDEGEGYYYTFTKEELENALQKENLSLGYELRPSGDIDGRYILHFRSTPDFHKWTPVLRDLQFLQSDRVKPETDTKQILSWNSFLCVGYARAYIYTQDIKYLELFKKLFEHIYTTNLDENNFKLWRIVYPSGEKIEGVAEDYALFSLCALFAFRFFQEDRFLSWRDQAIEILESNFSHNGSIVEAPVGSRVAKSFDSFADDMLPDANSVYLEVLSTSALLEPSTKILQKLDKLRQSLIPKVMQAPVYRSYAGSVLSKIEKMQKLETNLAWSEIPTPLSESYWLYKKSNSERESFLQMCTIEKCTAPIVGKEACENFLRTTFYKPL